MSDHPREEIRASYPAVELRTAEGGGMPTMVGHFARFNEWTRIDSAREGQFMERIAPGAFRKTLAENLDRVRVLFQHGRDPQIGDKPLGPIASVREDDDGAWYEVPLLDTSYNRDLLPGLEAGLYGASFRFSVPDDPEKDSWTMKPARSPHNPDALPERTIREAKLLEFGPVTFPAYAGATAGVRSLTLSDLDAAVAPPEDALPNDGAELAHSDGGSREEIPVEIPPKETSRMDEYVTLDEKESRVREIAQSMTELAGQFPGVMPEEAQVRWDALDTEATALRADIAAVRTRMARLAEIASKPQNTEQGYNPPNIIRRPSESDIYDLGSLRTLDPDTRSTRLRDNAMRAIETMTFPHFRADQDGGKAALAALVDFSDTEEQEVARRILGTNSPQYRRDFNRYIRSGGSERGTALAVGVDGTGGYAVPVAFDPTVIAIGAHTSINPFRAACRVVQIVGTDTWQALTSTAVTAAYALEAAAATEQGPTFARPEFVAKRAHAFVTVSYEMAQDRADIASELSVLFQEAKDTLEENQFAVGVGTTVYPQGMGLKDAYTRVDSATNDTIAVGDLYSVEAAMPIRHRMNAAWFLSRKAIRAFQAFETTGGQLFNAPNYAATPNPATNGTGNTGLTLLGYPIWETPSMPYTPTTDDTTAGVLCDPRSYVIVDRVGMSVKVIPDMLNGATPSFPTGEIGIYAFWRGTARVLNVDAGRQLAVQ